MTLHLAVIKRHMLKLINHKRFAYFETLCNYTGKCKTIGGLKNEQVLAIFRTGAGVKNKENLYLLSL